MVFCPNCGHDVKDGAKFCQNCGSEIVQTQSDEKQTKFCQNCGFELPDGVKYCPSCGFTTSKQIHSTNNQGTVCNPNKSAGLAGLLSFLIIGLGQIYLGLTKKGIILFVAALISGALTSLFVGWILWFIIWIYSMYDAYDSAIKMNDGIGVEDKIDFSNIF